MKVIDWLLSSGKALKDKEIENISQWRSLADHHTSGFDKPIEKSIIGGFVADRMAYAFLSGYEFALQKHFPCLPQAGLTAFCVSEKGGSRPKAINTVLLHDQERGGYILKGQKSFVTCADEAEYLLVAAKLVEADQKNQAINEDPMRPLIKVVLVKANSPGINVEISPAMPFIPELKKGSLALENLKVSKENVLDGDGYSEFIKPFSCVEGVYVLASISAQFLRLAFLFNWPEKIKAKLLSVIVTLITLEQGDMCSAPAEIVMSGLKEQLKLITEESKPLWNVLPEHHNKRLLRDGGMLMMSDKAHLTRLERAWQQYS